MKKRKPVKHAHRKAMISQKKASGRYSRPHLPKSEICNCICSLTHCDFCWAYRKRRNCLYPLLNQ